LPALFSSAHFKRDVAGNHRLLTHMLRIPFSRLPDIFALASLCVVAQNTVDSIAKIELDIDRNRPDTGCIVNTVSLWTCHHFLRPKGGALSVRVLRQPTKGQRPTAKMVGEISLIRRIRCRDRLRAWITVSLCVVGVEYAIRLRDKILLAKDFNRGSLIFLEVQRPCYIVSYLRLLYESSNYINTASLVSVLVPVSVLVRGSVLI